MRNISSTPLSAAAMLLGVAAFVSIASPASASVVCADGTVVTATATTKLDQRPDAKLPSVHAFANVSSENVVGNAKPVT